MVFRKTHGSGPGRAVERASWRSARACLAPVLLLALTACDVQPSAARAILRERGFERIDLIAEPAFGRPCDWSEPYARRFLARDRDGRLVTGLICATGEDAQDARLLGVEAVATRAPAWDSFGAVR